MILDTNAVSALLSEERAFLRRFPPYFHHHLPAIVIGEYKAGLLRSTIRADLEVRFRELIVESTTLDVNVETAEVYATLLASLRETGGPIPTNDIWIAALAIQHDVPLISSDPHFDRIPEVRRVTW